MTTLDRLTDEHRDLTRRTAQPKFIKPMLAKLTDDYFSDKNWIFERKLDGVRVIAVSKRNKVHLYSRNRKNVSETYPEIVDQLEDQSTTGWIIDGEIVAFEGKVTSFSRLQNRMKINDPDEARASRVAVFYYIFDIMFVERHDVTKVPLLERKKLLKATLEFNKRLRFTAHRRENGEAYRKEACKKGWEGVIAKKADSVYKKSRSSDWLKFKCVHEQELVIGGYTEPEGSRIGFGALLVGYYDGGNLRYAGKVGTGYDDETLERLGNRMKRIERETSPFAGTVREKTAHWIQPKLVGQFGFTEWTGDNKLRHPRFLGLRDDKKPKQVKKEEPGS